MCNGVLLYSVLNDTQSIGRTIHMRRVLYKKIITRRDLRENPDWIFLFGDNVAEWGDAGQAKAMRGEPNAIGIPTKWYPATNAGAYFTDFEKARPYVDAAFNSIPLGVTVIVPYFGLGTGMAKLPEKCPELLDYINKRIENL